MKKIFCIYVNPAADDNVVELGVRILGVKFGIALMLNVDKHYGLTCGVLPFAGLVDRKEADND